MTSTIDIVDKPSRHKKTVNTTINKPINQITIYESILNESKSNVFSKSPVPKQSLINISKANIYANCDLKCSLQFDYSNTLLVAKNNEKQLTFTCEETNAPPVTYNNKKYNVSSFSLFAPSLHQWNGEVVPAELIIEHLPVLGGKSLYISVPILETGSPASISSSLLTDIIGEVSKSSPGNGDTTNLNIMNFSLQNIVPSAPFYTYYGENDFSQGDFIVFDKVNHIPLEGKTLETLVSLIQRSYIIMFGGYLYYNAKGPNQTETDIYISCKPTGTTNEPIEEKPVYQNPTNYDLSTLLNNQYFILFLLSLGFILVLFLVNYLFDKGTGFSMGMGKTKVIPLSGAKP